MNKVGAAHCTKSSNKSHSTGNLYFGSTVAKNAFCELKKPQRDQTGWHYIVQIRVAKCEFKAAGASVSLVMCSGLLEPPWPQCFPAGLGT